MKKRKTNHLQIQKKTISKLGSTSIKGGTNTTGTAEPPLTFDPLNSRCICATGLFCQASSNCTT
ncbi:hypothetical protein [uncultured Kordia sp.]|uniref:hypothetical protein n=1 Tax=uncultured Kordia sp. TaxID=507699 RepID=UPI00262878F9|nr:hypothetical protein [uncultured Kordia sp.]